MTRISPRAVGLAHARAGILGNPSDGYGGKAIACSVRNFAARVSIEPGDSFTVAAGGATVVLTDPDDVLSGSALKGTEGLPRLMLAAWRRWANHTAWSPRRDGPCTLTGETDIPRQVGLAGSSAVIIATMRALSKAFGGSVSPFDLAELALATEVDDLGIAAGPMDRVIQAYEGVMVMDLAPPRSEASYQRLDPKLIPPTVIAWDPSGGTASGVAHGDLRERWRNGDPLVLTTINELRDLVDRGVEAMHNHDRLTFHDLVNHNFELRCRIFPVGGRDRQMVRIARECGAAAKLCGSGGAVLVVPSGDSDLPSLERALSAAGFRSCRTEMA